MAIKTQRELRRQFWRDHPNLPRRKIPNYSGNGKMHVTDARVAFSDYKDMLSRNGDLSQELAQKTTLSE